MKVWRETASGPQIARVKFRKAARDDDYVRFVRRRDRVMRSTRDLLSTLATLTVRTVRLQFSGAPAKLQCRILFPVNVTPCETGGFKLRLDHETIELDFLR